jgi:hypothetical protein
MPQFKLDHLSGRYDHLVDRALTVHLPRPGKRSFAKSRCADLRECAMPHVRGIALRQFPESDQGRDQGVHRSARYVRMVAPGGAQSVYDNI